MGLTKPERELLGSIAGIGPSKLARRLGMEKRPKYLELAIDRLLARRLVVPSPVGGTYTLTEWGTRALEHPNGAPSPYWAGSLLQALRDEPKWWVCGELADLIRESPVGSSIGGRVVGDGWRLDRFPFIQIGPVSCTLGDVWASPLAELSAWVQIDIWNDDSTQSHRQVLDIFLELREYLLEYRGPFLCFPGAVIGPRSKAGEPEFLSPDRLRSDWRVHADPTMFTGESLAQRHGFWIKSRSSRQLGEVGDARETRLLRSASDAPSEHR